MRSDVATLARMAKERSVLRESTVLVAICLLDTIYTLLAVRMGWARETNPLLIGSLQHSDAAFLVLKGATFLVPVALLEMIRPLRPALVPHALRLCVAAYLAIYVIGSIGLLFAR